MAYAVREIEHAGPLDDAQAMAEAFRLHTSAQERLRARAWLLGQRLRLDGQMARWHDAAWLLGAGLAVLVVLMANAMVWSMLTSERTINAGSAFVAALGVHALTLLLWLATLLLARHLPGAGGRLSLGRLLLQLLARWPLGRSEYSLMLASGASQMLRQARLAPWAFGLVSHMVWATSFVLVLAGLLLAFAFRQYHLTWETTILSSAWMDAFVQATGWLPAWLGFPVPGITVAQGSGTQALPLGDSARSAALWLLGCVLVYGLLVRGLCALWCAGVWQRRKNRLQLDTSDPYFRRLLARFEALEPSRITDQEGARPAVPSASPPLSLENTPGALAVVGFELPQAQAWPPQPLAAQAALVERIAGTVQERQAVLAALAHLRPQALLLVCNAAATPDRGTERFMREACRYAAHCAVWLASAAGTPPAAAHTQRWHHWLEALGLPQLARLDDPTEAQAWADTHHGPPD